MTTSEIAELLEKAKIIDDSMKFQDYMNKEKLSQQVQIGEYIVSSDMSYEELSKLITRIRRSESACSATYGLSPTRL